MRRDPKRLGLSAVLVVLAAVGTASVALASEELAPTSAAPVVDPADVDWVTNNIVCSCGCNLTVYECEKSMTCEVSTAMKEDVTTLLATGLSPPEVVDALAAQYGEQVRAAPSKRGFGLAAWTMPFAVLLAGGLVVMTAMRRWGRRAGVGAEPVPEVEDEYLAAVEDELRRRS